MDMGSRLTSCLLSSCLLLLLMIFYRAELPTLPVIGGDSCSGRRVFVYDLPERFNQELLNRCNSKIVAWLDFCRHLSNDGFGEPVEEDVLGEAWYRTDSYMLEVIFHSRIRSYSCLTNSSAEADALFLPYYAGLDALHYLYNAGADKSQHGAELIEWMNQNAAREWHRRGGRDHFLAMGRTSWDFHSSGGNNSSSWGTHILSSSWFSNMSILFVERNPWEVNQHAVPYPTSFHPGNRGELRRWVDRVSSSDRRYLFSFAGAARPEQEESIRGLLLEQCLGSENCSFVDCGRLRCGHNPVPVITSFLSSRFCLQPRGDTSTRRSAFDAIVSGCIPVFFHRDSAYSQYSWHLPADPESFSVFVDEDDVRGGRVRVEDRLREFSSEEVERMRGVLLRMIPRVIYMKHHVAGADDAFDISIQKAVQGAK